MGAKIMLVGLGSLGSVLLELLAREPHIERIVVASRTSDQGIARCNLARLSALAQGYRPQISFFSIDLNALDQAAELIQREAPDIILSTATLQTWWLPHLLPSQQATAIQRMGFGMWLPVHLPLTMKLMQAVQAASYQGFTVTAPFPDVVNCVLGKLGLAPSCGMGNLDEIVPKVQLLASEKMGMPFEALRIWLVAHHAFEAAAFGAALDELPPYFLRVEYGGSDVTHAINAEQLLLAPYPITPGPATHFLTAGSAIRLVRALLSEQGSLLHAPAPHGLPGGYPVIASQSGVRAAPIPGLLPSEAIAINERSHRFDGIERIEDDGTIIFCDDAVEAAREVLGYHCPRLPPHTAEDAAAELMGRFRSFAADHGAVLPS